MTPLSREKLATTVSVSGTSTVVQFAGMTPGYTGLMQVNFVMPGLAPGDYAMQVSRESVPHRPAADNKIEFWYYR